MLGTLNHEVYNPRLGVEAILLPGAVMGSIAGLDIAPGLTDKLPPGRSVP